MLFDIEGDGLNPTRIHCMSYTFDFKTVYSTTDYDKMRDLVSKAKILIGHNIIRFDIPVLERILDIKVKSRLIDTLALSWYLNTKRFVHGLDSFGQDYGIPKPKIEDWDNLSVEEYIHRCEEDVKINSALWLDLRKHLLEIYPTKKSADRLINYLTFKMQCVAMQEKSRWKLDIDLAEKTKERLEAFQSEKIEILTKAMPPVAITVKKTKPAKPFKKDGSYSVHGAKWFKLLKDQGLPKDYDGEIELQVSEEPGNPKSPDQVKAWLYSLGWKPQTYKYVRDDDGSERKIEQVMLPRGGGVCPSVLSLAAVEPSIEALDGLSVATHRLGIINGFLRDHVDGYLRATVDGLTNTLRFKHKELVNLPGIDKPWGKEVRGCLIAPEGYELCGSDMSSLEDMTKRHYMYPHDPEYVKEMSRPDFDPHLDLAKFAGKVTQEEIIRHLDKLDDFDLSGLRKLYKVANYSCTYGVQPPRLAREAGLSLEKGQELHATYWQRNWAIKAIADEQTVITVRKEMWLYNPVSGLYYSLRNTKDIFSTLNQGTGVYCFDMWVREVITRRPQLTGQFHDEIILCLRVGHREDCFNLLKDAIKSVNEKLKLNIELDISIQFGDRYSDIH